MSPRFVSLALSPGLDVGLLACNYDLLDKRGEKTAEGRRQGCLVLSIRKNWVAYFPVKASAFLNRYEEWPQYEKGTLERSIEQQVARYERHCAAKRERSAMRRKAFAQLKPANAGDYPILIVLAVAARVATNLD